jgi:hypothetical protein
MIAVAEQADAQSKLVTVTTICQMVEDPGAVSRKRVELRATVRSHKEWPALVSPTKCSNPLQTKGHAVWTTDINYRWAGRKSASKGRQQIQQRIEQLRPGELLEATFSGIILTKSREEYDAMRLQNGSWVLVTGFGHMNAYFAELVIESVGDITVVRAEGDGQE